MDDDSCGICLGKKIQKSFLDGCTHSFCFTCVRRWAEEGTNLCPLCKTKFNAIRKPVVAPNANSIDQMFKRRKLSVRDEDEQKQSETITFVPDKEQRTPEEDIEEVRQLIESQGYGHNLRDTTRRRRESSTALANYAMQRRSRVEGLSQDKDIHRSVNVNKNIPQRDRDDDLDVIEVESSQPLSQLSRLRRHPSVSANTINVHNIPKKESTMNKVATDQFNKENIKPQSKMATKSHVDARQSSIRDMLQTQQRNVQTMKQSSIFQNTANNAQKQTNIREPLVNITNVVNNSNERIVPVHPGSKTRPAPADSQVAFQLQQFYTCTFVRTVLQPLYEDEKISRELYKQVVMSVTKQFMQDISPNQRPVCLSPKRKKVICRMVSSQLQQRGLQI